MSQTPPALTLTRPWGWAIIHAGKDVENRTWPTRYRGPLFIHQGKGVDRDARWCPPMRRAMDAAGPDKDQTRFNQAGAILGWISLTGCHEAAAGCCASEWAMPGQWHWELRDPKPLRQAIGANGRLGLWQPGPELVDEIRKAATEDG